MRVGREFIILAPGISVSHNRTPDVGKSSLNLNSLLSLVCSIRENLHRLVVGLTDEGVELSVELLK